LYREFVVAKQRALHDAERDLSLAWHIAAFERQKRLPDLAEVIGRIRGQAQQKQPVAEMKEVVHAMASVYGLKVRKGRRRG